MKISSLLFSAAAALLQAPAILAYPGMGGGAGAEAAHGAIMESLHNEMGKRQPGGAAPGSDELIGDLATLPNNQLTPVGQALKAMLQLQIPSFDATSTYTKPGTINSAACLADTCCKWSYIADAMRTAFVTSGQCNGLARAAVRLGFHDAAAWHRGLTNTAGADGSIVLSGTELSRSENNGLQAVGAQMAAWKATYNVGMADLIQFGAKVAAKVCPGGPRIRSFVGRIDRTSANPNGLLPNVNSPAATLIALFDNKTIVAGGLAALIGAHTVSRQQFFNPALALTPQDSTPGLWDNIYYTQTIAQNPPAGVLRFPSDTALAAHPASGPSMQFFSTNLGRTIWNRAYSAEYLRMSMLGVYNMNTLTECTKVLPL